MHTENAFPIKPGSLNIFPSYTLKNVKMQATVYVETNLFFNSSNPLLIGSLLCDLIEDIDNFR